MRDPSCRRSWLAASCWSLVLPLVAQSPPLSVGPVFPHLTVMAPGAASDSETGIGALVPWADRLWAIGYVAHTRGEGIGLYEIDERLQMKLHPMSVTGTFANRLVHWESKQVFLGPHAIAADGTVRKLFGTSIERNAIHGSDSPENAARELGFFFAETERIAAR